MSGPPPAPLVQPAIAPAAGSLLASTAGRLLVSSVLSDAASPSGGAITLDSLARSIADLTRSVTDTQRGSHAGGVGNPRPAATTASPPPNFVSPIAIADPIVDGGAATTGLLVDHSHHNGVAAALRGADGAGRGRWHTGRGHHLWRG
jgi:hypothetical protein